jgi:hypothetical protein
MTIKTKQTPRVASSNLLPGETTPTWQMELLLSGGLVLLVYQLIGASDVWLAKWQGQLITEWRIAIDSFYMFLQAALWALFIAFCLHLVLRCFWASMVGLQSVYPGGIKWDQVIRGPHGLKDLREKLPTLSVAIERADNTASLVFGLGGLLMMFCLQIFLIAGIAIVMVNSLAVFMPGGRRLFIWFAALWASLFAPVVLAQTLDRFVGKRLPPGGRLERVTKFGVALGNRIFPRSLSTMMYTFTSNLGRIKGMVIFIGLTYVVIGLVMLKLSSANHGYSFFTPKFMPTFDAPGMVNALHYADQRKGADRFSDAPFVQSMINSDAFLVVRIPLTMQRYAPAIESQCTASAVAAPDGEKTLEAVAHLQSLLNCLSPMHQILLDGKALPTTFKLEHQAASDTRNLLQMIDLRELAAGAHSVTVVQPMTKGRSEEDAQPGTVAKKTKVSEIAFWK